MEERAVAAPIAAVLRTDRGVTARTESSSRRRHLPMS